MSEKRWIKDYLAPLVTAPGADGLRDDVARLSSASIVTTDTLIDGVHFLADDPIETVAWKLVRVNVSDIVAKGGAPKEALTNIAWPRGRTEADFAAFAKGLGEALRDRAIELIGGDTVFHNGPLSISLTLTGNTYGAPVRRSGAEPGDTIYVTGEIGWGYQGLLDRKAGRDTAAARRYQIPDVPGDDSARLIAEHASASMDISDGLLIDLKALCEASGVGAEIALDAIPLCAPTDNIEKILAQLTGGDDYQCLFTAKAERLEGATAIGSVTQALGLKLSFNGEGVAMPAKLGFDHGQSGSSEATPVKNA